jgi:hypothetical protein
MNKLMTALVVAGLATRLSCQMLPSTICEIQRQRAALEQRSAAHRSYEKELVKVRGRLVFSPRGFFILSEPGCPAIPIADAGRAVEPKVPFEVLKDENYDKLKSTRSLPREDVILAELEGRLDSMSKVLRGSWKAGDAGLHLAQYKYRLVLRRVVALQMTEHQKP